MTEDATPVDGTISTDDQTTTVDDQTTQSQDWLKWPAKLLHQRNEARRGEEERRQKYEQLAKDVFKSESSKQATQQELDTLKARVSEEEYAAVVKEMEDTPWLTPLKAYKLVNPDEFARGKTFDLTWSVPKSITQPDEKPKTLDEQWASLRQQEAEGKLTL